MGVRLALVIGAGAASPAFAVGGRLWMACGCVRPYPQRSSSASSQTLHRDLIVRVDADRGGHAHGLGDDAFSVQLGMRDERARRRQRVGPAGADADQSIVGLDDV